MQLQAVAGQEAIEDAEDEDQNGSFGKEGGYPVRGDLDELLQETIAIAIPSWRGVLKGR